MSDEVQRPPMLSLASGIAERTWLPRSSRGRILFAIRAVATVALAASALATPGFLAPVSVLSLLTTMSFIGCVAVGMSFITLSGNIMSFALGATLSSTAMVFIIFMPWGLAAALVMAFAFSGVLTGLQGWVVGYFRTNPIIVSMATLSLIIGAVVFLTGGQGVYLTGNGADLLKGRIGPVPMPLAVFVAAVIVGQLVLSSTRFGRNVYMVGSNSRAALAAGIQTWRTVTASYVMAGLFTALAGVLMAARYGAGDMEQGQGYEYHAISAVLVGGNAIQGGEGSIIRTFFGAFIIALCEGLLQFHGFSTQIQYLAIGIIVLGVIMLHTLGERG